MLVKVLITPYIPQFQVSELWIPYKKMKETKRVVKISLNK